MRKILLFVLLITFIFFNSCDKKRYYDPESAWIYQKFLDSLNMHCPPGESENYFEGLIDGRNVCYKDGIESYKYKFLVYNSIVTASPSLVIGQKQNSKAMKMPGIGFFPYPKKTGKEIFRINFPYFYPNRTEESYLDSLFSIKYHKVKPISEDITVNVRDTIKFTVEFMMIDYYDSNGGNAYTISSIYGDQDDSFIEIEKVGKEIINNVIYYTLDINLECFLYYNLNYREKGLWGKLENGKLHVKFSVKK